MLPQERKKRKRNLKKYIFKISTHKNTPKIKSFSVSRVGGIQNIEHNKFEIFTSGSNIDHSLLSYTDQQYSNSFTALTVFEIILNTDIIEKLDIANSKNLFLSTWFALMSNKCIRLDLNTIFRYVFK